MTTTLVRLMTRGAVIALGVLATATPAAAQLGSASAATLALGGTGTAIARGFDAIAANPAGLAMPGSGGFTLALLPIVGAEGATPVTMRDIQRFSGRVIDDATKHRWSDRVRDAGAEHIAALGDVTWLALSMGRVGVQLTTSAQAVGSLTPDAAQVLLFGNAGETGDAGRYALTGSGFTGMVTHTVAVAYAQPFVFARGSGAPSRLAVGATIKYIRGLALAHGRETGGLLNDAPLDLRVQFPIVSSAMSGALDDNGHGIALDLGAAWQAGRWRAGLAVRNAASTFAWDRSRFTFRPGTARFTGETSSSDFDERSLDQAPSELAAVLDRATFDPTVALGVAVQLGGSLLVSGDVSNRFGDAIAFTPAMQAGLGAEWRVMRWLPIRGGVSALTGGHQASGGAGLRLGAFGLDASMAARTTDSRAQRIYAVTASFGAR